MEELKQLVFVESAEIFYGGFMNGKSEKRYFHAERRMDHIPQRILVQQFEMKRLDKKGIRDMITQLDYKKAELQEQLKGFE